MGCCGPGEHQGVAGVVDDRVQYLTAPTRAPPARAGAISSADLRLRCMTGEWAVGGGGEQVVQEHSGTDVEALPDPVLQRVEE